jgi:hypothetical protein
LCVSLFGLIYCELVNKNVERSIDLSSQREKVSLQITVSNDGNQPTSSYKFLVPNFAHLAFSEFKDSTGSVLTATNAGKDSKAEK